MRAMIFAAGLGTRLRPITDTIPKALVPIAGRPILEHVIKKLKAAGFNEIIINVHHFGQQIIDFIQANNNFGITIHISDERDMLLDTGGGIKRAIESFPSDEPILIHNVDILSDIDLNKLYRFHIESGNDATLMVSQRDTSRYLVFDNRNRLNGWININTGETKPEGFKYNPDINNKYAFSGVHVVSKSIFNFMGNKWTGKFPIMDFYLNECNTATIGACFKSEIKLIDIGKPNNLEKAEEFISSLSSNDNYNLY